MIACWFAIPAGPALAQYGGGGGGGGGHGGGKDPDADEAAKKKKDEEWNTNALALPGKKNAGPCPYVKVLYDAGLICRQDVAPTSPYGRRPGDGNAARGRR